MTLTQYLKQHDLTDEAFAAMIDVERSTVSRLRGSQIPKRDIMHRIVQATNGAVTANDFYGVAA